MVNSGLSLAEQKLTLIHELLHVRKMLAGYWGQNKWLEKKIESEAEDFLNLHPIIATWLLRTAEYWQDYTYKPPQLL